MHKKPEGVPPLARSVANDVLDWDQVDDRRIEMTKDVLGLSPSDRQALGMSAPRAGDLDAPTLGGAELALAEVLARGGAMTPTRSRAEPYVPSGAVGRAHPRKTR